ncbi:GNAT family N-acetyltransferase [Cellulomonas sp. HZM]|uniref:GNAT family N-acetyltransferase n=1 Tax=Cellulomonas sp. HZM TaxID=1454010 RepID=UPI00068A32DE|nr:GNAT family N-acetyltransferase [Cellulomonas sp. HZM]
MTARAPGAQVEAATWPPLRTVVTSGGWRVGLSGGLTRRANSALVADDVGRPVTSRPEAAAQLDEVEAVYASAGLTATVRTRARTGSALGDELQRRGYRLVARSLVLARPGVPRGGAAGGGAAGAGAGAGSETGDLELIVEDEPTTAWVTGWLGVKSAAADVGLARDIVAGAPAWYLTARRDGGAVGGIRVAVADGWAALSCLTVVPSARRLGIGRGLTLAAVALAADHGVHDVFLQVEAANKGATALYRTLGFEHVDEYHYAEL